MRTSGQVAQKVKQAQFRHIKREIKRLLKQTPSNCKQNRTLELDIGPVGVCSLDCDLCDARFRDRSQECGKWEPRHQKEQIKASLKEFFRTRGRADIAVRFPDVAALLWVLDDETPDLPDEDEDTEDEGLRKVLVRILDLEKGTRSAVVGAVQDAVQSAQAARRAWNSQIEETEGLRTQLEEKTQELEEKTQELQTLRLQVEQALTAVAEKPEPVSWWRRWLPWG